MLNKWGIFYLAVHLQSLQFSPGNGHIPSHPNLSPPSQSLRGILMCLENTGERRWEKESHQELGSGTNTSKWKQWLCFRWKNNGILLLGGEPCMQQEKTGLLTWNHRSWTLTSLNQYKGLKPLSQDNLQKENYWVLARFNSTAGIPWRRGKYAQFYTVRGKSEGKQ